MEKFDLEKAFTIIERGEFTSTASKMRQLSSLKHRIAHYFLSIDIDFQGIIEVEENKKIDYLIDMFLVEKEEDFEWRNTGYYQEKLKSAKFDILKQKEENKKGNSKEFETIEEIYRKALEAETNGQMREKIDSYWQKVKELTSGENELYKNALEILKELDKALSEVIDNVTVTVVDKEIIIDDAKKIVIKNSDKFIYFNRIIQKSKDNKLLDFHNWFVELDDTLDKLRKALIE